MSASETRHLLDEIDRWKERCRHVERSHHDCLAALNEAHDAIESYAEATGMLLMERPHLAQRDAPAALSSPETE